MEIIQLNKFSNLHNGKTIIFCKTDYIIEEFENISKLDNDVILISANSDYAITDELVNLAPKNIKKWFAQNALSKNEILIPIPLGLENKTPSVRDGHGIGYFERVQEKETLLNNIKNKKPEKFIYSNFNIHTNFNQRINYKNVSINCEHIDWEENNLSLPEYFNKILEYKMILCPIGNGIDTHRLWEVLYSNRVPITVKVGDFKIYDLYRELPIIVLDNISDLLNHDLIKEKYYSTLNGNYNLNFLDYYYWNNKIKELL
jgi:hypothetical protein